jgi:hypothetical protein
MKMEQTKKIPLHGYLSTACSDALQVVLAYAWLALGLHGAGNAVQAIGWALAVLAVLFGLTYMSSDSARPLPRHHALLRGYGYLRFLARVVLYAWTGCLWLVGAYILGQVLVAAARHKSDSLETAAHGRDAGQ